MNKLSKGSAAGIGVAFGVMAFMIVNVAMGRELLPGPRRAHTPIEVPVINNDPEALYEDNCSACHQLTGDGVPGAFPPLAGSSWTTGDRETPIRVVLMGIQGSIDVKGETFNGVMPSQGHLTDEQLAGILTYVRKSWGNDGSAVKAKHVKAMREELSSRSAPWNGGAELSAARGQ